MDHAITIGMVVEFALAVGGGLIVLTILFVILAAYAKGFTR